jgi:hypothetical protein
MVRCTLADDLSACIGRSRVVLIQCSVKSRLSISHRLPAWQMPAKMEELCSQAGHTVKEAAQAAIKKGNAIGK